MAVQHQNLPFQTQQHHQISGRKIFILGVASLASTLSGSVDVETASRDPTFINLDSTDSKGELVVESSLGCTIDCSTSEDCRQGLMNVTSEADAVIHVVSHDSLHTGVAGNHLLSADDSDPSTWTSS